MELERHHVCAFLGGHLYASDPADRDQYGLGVDRNGAPADSLNESLSLGTYLEAYF